MKVFGIVGSKRKNWNTSSLVKKVLESAKEEGVDTELVFLGDYSIAGCTGCEGCKDTYKCVINDDMQKIYPLLMEADAVVLGSPTYFYNVTADVKAFIDRCYCFEVISEEDRSVWMGISEAMGGKYATAIAIAVCVQHSEVEMGYTGEVMAKPLEALGYRVLDIVKILGLFENGKASEEQNVLDQTSRAGKRLVKTLNLRKK